MNVYRSIMDCKMTSASKYDNVDGGSGDDCNSHHDSVTVTNNSANKNNNTDLGDLQRARECEQREIHLATPTP